MTLTHCPNCNHELPKPVIGRPPKKPMRWDGEDYWLCTCCEKHLTADHFGIDNNAINGLTSWCVECRKGR